jgi:hypothetical protein
MSKPSKVRLEKKKVREKESYKKLLKRKEVLVKKAKQEKAEWKIERATREKKAPFVKPPPINHPKTAEEIALQIEANLQKLKDMEEEYQKTVNEREGLNEALEAEGFKTLQEKLDFLNKNAQEQAEKQAEEMQKNLEKSAKKSRKKASETTK